MAAAARAHRYNSPAIILHWVMALGFFLMLGSGIVMTYAPIEQRLQFNLYQWHKGGGVLLLLAFGLRITWRVISAYVDQIPPLPKSIPPIEQRVAKLGHWGLYALMVMMPISGWVMVSSSVYGLPTIVFGWFEWPHIPNIQGDQAIETVAKQTHFYLAIAFGVMILAHMVAVVKHAKKDDENLLRRIWWARPTSTDT